MRRDSPPAEPVNWLGVSQTRSHATSLRCHAGEAAPPEKIPSRLRLWWRINSTGGLALLKERANCRSASPRPSSLRRSRRIGWWMGCAITWSAAPVRLGRRHATFRSHARPSVKGPFVFQGTWFVWLVSQWMTRNDAVKYTQSARCCIYCVIAWWPGQKPSRMFWKCWFHPLVFNAESGLHSREENEKKKKREAPLWLN